MSDKLHIPATVVAHVLDIVIDLNYFAWGSKHAFSTTISAWKITVTILK